MIPTDLRISASRRLAVDAAHANVARLDQWARQALMEWTVLMAILVTSDSVETMCPTPLNMLSNSLSNARANLQLV